MRAQQVDGTRAGASVETHAVLRAPTPTDVGRPPSDASGALPPPRLELPQPHAVASAPAQRPSPGTLKRALIAADAVAVGFGLFAAIVWHELARPGEISASSHLELAVVSFPVWMIALAMNRVYKARAVTRPSEELRRIFNASAASVGATVAIAFAIQFKELSRLWMLSVLVMVPAFLIVERAIARRVFTMLRRSGQLVRKVVVVGTDAEAIGLVHAMQRRPELGYHAVGFVGPDDLGDRGGCRVLGDLDDVERVLAETGANGVMISLASVHGERLNRMTRALTDAGHHVTLSSGLSDIDLVRFRAQDIGGRTVLYVEQTVRTGWRAAAKRTFDVAVALFGLIVTAPVLAVAALFIRFSSSGPILFRQERVGREGKSFHIYKLRTMVVDAEQRKAELLAANEADGPLFKMSADPRVTRVGGLLRKLSIDELPQFYNVLRGQMSVVGPRPALPDEVAQWDPQLRDRLRVLPGITGLWQVSGRSDTSFDEYRRLDLFYVDNWSLVHDARIVAKTFSVVLASRGAR